jgi:hypothetical protein
MSASWAAVIVAVVVAAAGLVAFLLREGQREGKLDAVLERLSLITADHENRIRDLERNPVRPRGRP